VIFFAPAGDDAWLEHLARRLDGLPLRQVAFSLSDRRLTSRHCLPLASADKFPGHYRGRKTAQAALAERARCMASVALLTCIFFIRCQRWIDTVFIEMLSF